MTILKKKEDVHPETHEHLATALEATVQNSANPDAPATEQPPAVAPAQHAAKHSWFKSFFPDPETLDRLFATEHLGNFVITDRKTGKQDFEAMPIYVRIGMHLLFYGKEQTKLLKWSSVENLLKSQTLSQGKIYNSTDPKIVVPHIEAFIKTYSVNLDELAKQDVKDYSTINEFFARKLKDGARPIDSPDDSSIVSSVADCRLTVWRNLDLAKKFWVKGKDFSVASLLNHDEKLVSLFGTNPSLAIFRLAPQDYHRYHSPANGTLGDVVNVPGDFYTVNPMAVNEEFDVFTSNRRDISILNSPDLVAGASSGTPIAIVAIGAMLVGAIEWSASSGSTVARGQDLGCFKYGGSTVIAIFPEDAGIVWDEDLLTASEKSLETVVRVGERIGKATGGSQ